jgi:hypothetical protein
MSKTTYLTAETDATGYVNNPDLWRECSATTLANAKRAASRARAFQGTAAHVGIRRADGRVVTIAENRPASAVDMASARQWREV